MFATALAVVVLCSSWGFLVHRTVNQLAIYQLPKSMQPFFYTNVAYLVKHSVRPDQRRNTDSTEASKHFIDSEPYGDSSLWKMPFSWTEAVNTYTKDTLEKYGYVPYWVMEMKQHLTRAFKNKNSDSILFYAADLGHYIADAHVPLHTSENYDGQLTGQKGLHSLWESVIPELELSKYNLYSKHKAVYLKKPEAAIWKTVRKAYTLVADVLQQEREVSQQFTDEQKYRVQNRNGREYKSYTADFAQAYSARLKNTVNQQLLSSSSLIADFWYTAWVDAGKPDLKSLMPASYTNADKKQYKKEYKAYKKNNLLKNDLLISRQEQKSAE